MDFSKLPMKCSALKLFSTAWISKHLQNRYLEVFRGAPEGRQAGLYWAWDAPGKHSCMSRQEPCGHPSLAAIAEGEHGWSVAAPGALWLQAVTEAWSCFPCWRAAPVCLTQSLIPKKDISALWSSERPLKALISDRLKYLGNVNSCAQGMLLSLTPAHSFAFWTFEDNWFLKTAAFPENQGLTRVGT